MRLIILAVLIASTVTAHSPPPAHHPGNSPPPPPDHSPSSLRHPPPPPKSHPFPPRPSRGSDSDKNSSDIPIPPPRPSSPRGSIGNKSPTRASRARSDGNRQKINVGKKIGLLFVGMAAVLQVAVVGFLGFKRWQISRMKASAADSPA